jgi:hypothetical protein
MERNPRNRGGFVVSGTDRARRARERLRACPTRLSHKRLLRQPSALGCARGAGPTSAPPKRAQESRLEALANAALRRGPEIESGLVNDLMGHTKTPRRSTFRPATEFSGPACVAGPGATSRLRDKRKYAEAGARRCAASSPTSRSRLEQPWSLRQTERTRFYAENPGE